MPRSEFESALSGEGWTQQEMDDLRAMIIEIVGLRDIHIKAKTTFRWLRKYLR